MSHLFDKETAKHILLRIEKLQPVAARQWGTMDVAQMMAHCSAALEVATGKKQYSRMFLGRLLGVFFKAHYLGPKPFDKNSPTDKNFVIKDTRDFHTEKQQLQVLVKEFADGGQEQCTVHPHSFLGKLTPHEWARSMYKHLDHHLRQFGA